MTVNEADTTNKLSPEKQEWAKLGMLFFLALLFAIVITYIFNLQNEEDRYNSDFYSRWYATQKLLEEKRNLYDWENGEEVAQNWTFRDPQPVQGLFFYPAYLLLFTLPLSFLPYLVANLLWSILIEVFLIVGLIIFYRLTGWPGSINKFSFFLLVALVLWPNVLHTSWEQFNSIGLLGWALMFWAIRNAGYGWAGISAGLLLFKPQHTFFVLFFYIIWMMRKADGWRFFVALGSTTLGLWAFGELFQRDWIFAFLDGLQNYQQVPEGVSSVAGDLLGHPLWSVAITLLWASIVWKQAGVEPENTQFWGLQAFSLGVGLFVVPIVGMWHTLILYPTFILIAAGWRQRIRLMQGHSFYGYRAMRVLYYVGLSVPLLIGILYIQGAEPASSFIYRTLGAIFTIVLALPLCFSWPGTRNAADPEAHQHKEPALANQ